MEIGGIISAIIVGIIIGALGRLFAPGKQNISIIVTIIVGIIAAILGELLANAIGVGGATDSGIHWMQIVIQIILAVIGVTIAANMLGRRRHV